MIENINNEDEKIDYMKILEKILERKNVSKIEIHTNNNLPEYIFLIED